MGNIYENYNLFKKVELIYKNDDGEELTIVGDVYAIKNSCVIVRAEKALNKSKSLPKEIDITINAYMNSGIYSADTSILEREEKEKNIYYILKYPKLSEHHQRREFYRANIQIPLTATIITDLLNNKCYKIKTSSKNICGNGICFTSDKKISEAEVIYIRLEFIEKVIEVSAKLIYSKPKSNKDDGIFVNALEFTEIKPRDIDFIVQKCFQHQLKAKEAL